MLCENLGQWLAAKDRTEFQYLNKTFSFPAFSVKEASKEARRLSLTSKRKLLQLRHRFIFFIFPSMTLAKVFSFVPYSEERFRSWSLYKDTFLQSSFFSRKEGIALQTVLPPSSLRPRRMRIHRGRGKKASFSMQYTASVSYGFVFDLTSDVLPNWYWEN